MGGGMDSFIVSMFAAKRVVSFCSDHAAAEPFGSYGVSLVVEVDTDDAVSRTARVILNFVEHSIFLPFAGRTPLARTVLSDMDGMEMIVQFRVAGFGFGKPFRKCIAFQCSRCQECLGAFGAGFHLIECLEDTTIRGPTEISKFRFEDADALIRAAIIVVRAVFAHPYGGGEIRGGVYAKSLIQY